MTNDNVEALIKFLEQAVEDVDGLKINLTQAQGRLKRARVTLYIKNTMFCNTLTLQGCCISRLVRLVYHLFQKNNVKIDNFGHA